MMAPNRNFTNFRAVYDDLTGEVERSTEQFLPDHLENWFSLLDETPGVHEIVKKLEQTMFLLFNRWLDDIMGIERPKFMVFAESLKQAREPTKPIELVWPSGRERRLGTQLLVIREIARRRITATAFGLRFLKDRTPETVGQDVIKHIFSPMARDLRRKFEEELSGNDDAPTPVLVEASVPASDRIVRLDHNSPAYQDAVNALDKLEHTLRTANDYDDVEDKEQRIAEVSAARRMLDAARVRVEPFATLVGPTIRYLAKKFADSGIGKAAGSAWDALVALLGSLM